MTPRAQPDLQLSWTGAEVVAWSWDGGQVHPARSSSGLYGSIIREWGWLPPGSWTRSAVVAAPRGRMEVAGIVLPPPAVLEAAAERRDRRLTASSRWVRSMVRLARHTAGAGHLRPVVLPAPDVPSGARARWQPVETPAIREALAAHAKIVPPTVRVRLHLDEGGAELPGDSDELTAAFHAWLVDLAARHALRSARWSPPLVGVRSTEASVVRAVGSALASTSGEVTTVGTRSAAAVACAHQLREHFERMCAAATGRPLVAARLRLGLPTGDEDDDAPWPVVLELADRDDPSRWCLASDVWGSTPLAVELAGRAEHLGELATAVRRARDQLVDEPSIGALFSPLSGDEAPSRVELDVDGAAALLANVDVLDTLAIPLLAPGQLAPSTARLKGAARPAAGGDGRLGRGALVDWTLVVDDREVDAAVIERATATGRSLLHVDGRWIRIDEAAARRALDALRVHEEQHSQVDAVTLLQLAATAVESGTDGPLVVGHGWIDELLAGLPDDRLTEGQEPAGFRGPLRHYQRRGLGWLQFLDRLGLGGCLADDMGLGKTPTTLAHLDGRPGPHLVLCPLSVVRNWQSEAARFTPDLRCLVHHGVDRPRGEAFAAALADADLVVTTYGLAIRDRAELTGVAWRTVVLDEAQAVKNPHTHAARLVRALPADQKLALTGTPVENRLGELWAILDAVNPGLLGPEKRFQQRWATPIERDGDAEAAERLRRLTSPFVLRRTKADRSLVPDLPDKVEQIAWATLTKEQATMYQAVVDQLLADAEAATGMRRRGLVLAALTRLKQICNHPAQAAGDGSRLHGRSGKLARFDELIVDLLDAGERALVFTQYREMGELLQRHLAAHLDVHAPFLHGGVAKARRDRMVEHFQAGSASPLLLVSLKAGGTGLNLTAATRVVHYDRWWNPAVEDQATDRAWRIGQQRAVFVHKLVCQGTVEERIAELIDDKRRIAGMVVGAGAGEAWLSELSTSQLRELVVLDREAVER